MSSEAAGGEGVELPRHPCHGRKLRTLTSSELQKVGCLVIMASFLLVAGANRWRGTSHNSPVRNVARERSLLESVEGTSMPSSVSHARRPPPLNQRTPSLSNVSLTGGPQHTPSLQPGSGTSAGRQRVLIEGGAYGLQLGDGNQRQCDLAVGTWVPESEENRYKYTPDTCTYNAREVCVKKKKKNAWNEWRWEMHGCEDWRISPQEINQCVQRTPVLFLGDSLVRNMYESLVCIQKTADPAVTVASKYLPDYFTFKTLFHGKDKQWGKVHRIDLSVPLFMDETRGRNAKGLTWRKEMMNYPVVVIGFGHHFKAPHFQSVNPSNVKKGKGQIRSPLEMYKVGIENWLAALHKINYPGRVLWIPFTPSHFDGGSWNSGGKCSMYTAPAKEPMRMSQVGTTAEDWLRALTSALAQGPNPRHAELFDVATMSDMRPDAHPGDASQFPIKVGVQDCVHWCMPGVTDTWNELLAYKMQCKG